MDTNKGKKLTSRERDLIAIWKGGKVSYRQIAKRLRRSVSTISDEIKRNSYHGIYVAIHAQELTDQRIIKSRKRDPLKDPKTYSYVIEKLRCGWSPEQISGRLKMENNNQPVICFETIYSFIYQDKNKGKRLWEYLPRKQKVRKKKYGRKVAKCHIPNRVSIHKRDKLIDKRKQFGHWEGDTVESKRQQSGGLHTEAERLTRHLAAYKIDHIDGKCTIEAQKYIFAPLPEKARKSTTLDNGRENHRHSELHELNMDTYFADPYSSWQRGTNEYHNGLLRRYFPKGTDFSKVSQEEIDDVVDEINNRPRKVLKFNTPQEVFDSYIQGVRIQARM